MLDASLILVNYRTETHLLAALKHLSALPAEMPARIIVVDNSPAGSLQEKLARHFPEVEYLPSAVNLGFAGGVNLGLTRAQRDYVILLNPDAQPEPGCLSGLIRALADRPAAVVAGPRLVPFESARVPWPSATRRDPDALTALIEYTPFRRCFKEGWLQEHYFVDPATTRQLTACAMVQGACFVIKRSWLDRLGFFDSERFFLYFEETDFCRRVRLQGGTVLYCPDLICHHQGGASLAGRGQDVVRFWSSFYHFQAKHYGAWRAVWLKGLLTLGLIGEYLLCRLKQRLGRKGIDPDLDDYIHVVAERLACHLGAGARES